MSPRGEFHPVKNYVQWIFFEESCLESFQVRSIFVHLFFFGGGNKFDAEWLAMTNRNLHERHAAPSMNKKWMHIPWRKAYCSQAPFKGRKLLEGDLFLTDVFHSRFSIGTSKPNLHLAPANPQKYSPKEAAFRSCMASQTARLLWKNQSPNTAGEKAR